MTDRERVLDALREAEEGGLHSHDIRVRGLSGNPAQRIAELEAEGYTIARKRENRGKRPGSRYYLIDAGASTEDLGRQHEVDGVGSGALFDPTETSVPRNAALEDFEEAA